MSQKPLNPEGGKATMIGVKLPRELRERLEADAERTGRKLSEVVREYLKQATADR